MKRKLNKGFSLVELIVVILVISIITALMIPGVVNWIKKAGTSVDVNNKAEIKNIAQAALSEYLAKGGTIPESGYTFYIRHEGICDNASGTEKMSTDEDALCPALAVLIDEGMKNDYPEVNHPPTKVYAIRIKSDKNVEVTIETGAY